MKLNSEGSAIERYQELSCDYSLIVFINVSKNEFVKSSGPTVGVSSKFIFHSMQCSIMSV